MRCDEVQLELEAYLQGQAPPAVSAAIEAHLATCRDCAEEAVIVRDLGRRLSSGLKSWVDHGVCPSELMERIEQRIAPARRRPWWRAWPAYAGVAVVILALVVAGAGKELPQGITSIPLLGPVASLLTPDQPASVAEHDGVTLEVSTVARDASGLHIQYMLRGPKLDTSADLSEFAPSLRTVSKSVKLKKLTGERKEGEVLVEAHFDPVPVGETPILSVKDLPGAGAGPWEVSIKQ